MDIKFSCHNDKECIIPVNMSHEEIEKHRLPHSCLECPYYISKIDDGKTINYCEWKKTINNR